MRTNCFSWGTSSSTRNVDCHGSGTFYSCSLYSCESQPLAAPAASWTNSVTEARMSTLSVLVGLPATAINALVFGKRQAALVPKWTEASPLQPEPAKPSLLFQLWPQWQSICWWSSLVLLQGASCYHRKPHHYSQSWGKESAGWMTKVSGLDLAPGLYI